MANFTAAWGYARFSIVNLCAHVATDPKELLALDYAEAVGPDNDRHITEAAGEASLIVAAWGASYPKALTPRISEVVELLAAAAPHLPVHHLGLTKNGDPRHPLFVLGTTEADEVGGMSFPARFNGQCPDCEERFTAGTEIRYSPEHRGVVHNVCPHPRVDSG